MASAILAKKVDLSGFGLKQLKLVGRGHYASCLLVEEADTGQTSVAKCVSLAALSEHDQESARQEVFLLQALRHPHIVAYHNSFVVDASNTLVIVMEYCQGGDLRKRIHQRAETGKHFAEDEIMAWFVQIASALRYIHEERVLHRDLKTSNVFLSQDARVVKLGDFGISRILEGTADAAVTMVGTPYYMSPEVCRNEPYSWKSDVWALGCVLYELCMLKHAFEASSLMGLVYKIVSDRFEPIPSFYSESLNVLVCELLTKSAEGRPGVAELLEKPFVEAFVAGALDVQPDSSRPAVAQAWQPPEVADDAGQEEAPHLKSEPVLPLEPHVKTQVLAARLRRRLVTEKVNWVSALAPYDDRGDGHVSLAAMRSALTSLPLGFSQAEIEAFLQALLPSQGSEVPLSAFEAMLAEAEQPEAQTVHAWARRLLEPFSSEVAMLLRACDTEKLGKLPATDFLGVLYKLLAGPEELVVMELLADKDSDGNVDYMRFADTFGAPPPPPRLPEIDRPLSPEDTGPETFVSFASKEPQFETLTSFS